MKKLVLLIILFILPVAAHAATLGKVQSNNIGLVGWWTLDGSQTNWATGKTNDSAGSATGQLVFMSTSTSPANGKVGQALSFDDTSSYVTMTPTLPTGDFTYSIWVKPNSTVDEMLFMSASSGGFLNELAIQIAGGKAIVILDNSSVIGASTATVPTQTWTHVAVTRSGSSVVLYLNGVRDNSGSSAATLDFGACPLFLGVDVDSGCSGGLGNYLNGLLDDARIYNRVLTAAEVVALYNSGKAMVAASSMGSTTAPLSNGLVGYWTLDGSKTNWATGKTLDSAGSNTGQLISMSTSTSPVFGKLGQALQFNGSSSFVDGGNNSSLDLDQKNQAVVFWFKTSQTYGVTGAYLLSKIGTPRKWTYAIVLQSTRMTYQRDDGTNNPIAQVSNTYNDGLWHHLVATDNGTMSLYIDGVLVSSVADTITNPTSNANSLKLASNGSDGGFTGNFFNGSLDDVRIYNHALSATDVRQLYNSGQPKIAQSAAVGSTTPLGSGLVGYWTLDGSKTNWATGKTLDSSGFGNTGQLVGMATSTAPAIGKVGQALNFNGLSTGINIVDNDSLSPPFFSIALWYKTSTPTATQSVYVQRESANIRNDIVVGSAIFCTLTNGSAANSGSVSTPAASLNSSWHFLVCAGDGQNVRTYLDGVLLFTDPLVGTSPNINSGVQIGQRNSTLFFNGSIDDVRIYNKTLSAQEVQQLYNMSK